MVWASQKVKKTSNRTKWGLPDAEQHATGRAIFNLLLVDYNSQHASLSAMAFEAAGNCSSATSGGPQVIFIMIYKNKLIWYESAIFQFGEDGVEMESNIRNMFP